MTNKTYHAGDISVSIDDCGNIRIMYPDGCNKLAALEEAGAHQKNHLDSLSERIKPLQNEYFTHQCIKQKIASEIQKLRKAAA